MEDQTLEVGLFFASYYFSFHFKHDYFAYFPFKISTRIKQESEFLYGDVLGNVKLSYYVNKLIVFYSSTLKMSVCSTYVITEMK